MQITRRSFAALVGLAYLSKGALAAPEKGAGAGIAPAVPSNTPDTSCFRRFHLCDGKPFWTKDALGRNHVLSSSKHWVETAEGWREMPWPEHGPGHSRFLEEYRA